ncbi:uncharacterized protein KGF55_003676 [Candida pseudojiufengensis]|uniref:uncharacterized protein n=1 Tax=Candida pseudojiufengensis TaxID=497109 RepID=UPI002224BB8C|nr:uncharacterized protein KGF55_003676 [Candida pseudojiufengensis]KAI5962600.1 hypothetical protein KGF55_003676 [Candida pseudojiufengensis]
MGKLKKGRRNVKNRLNPIASKSQHEIKKDESTRQSKILPLINKLKSTIPNDKSMALGAITVLAEDARMRQLLLKEKLVQVVTEYCLNDSNDEIVVEAFGLLRNLCIESGYDVVMFLWRQGIWTSIENALDKINNSFKYLTEKDIMEKDKSKIQLLFDFTENILSLITTLASEDESIYEFILAKIDPIIDFIFKTLKFHISGTFKISNKLFTALLEFIYEFSSESTEFVEKCDNFECWDEVSSYIEESNVKLSKIYLEGIKFNKYEVQQTTSDKTQEVCSEVLQQIYDTVKDFDLQQLRLRIETIQNLKNGNEPIRKDSNTIEKDLSSSNESKMEVKTDLLTIETGLTIITSILEHLSINEEDASEPVLLLPNTQNILFEKIGPMLIELLKFELTEKSLMLGKPILGAINNFGWLILSNEHLPVPWFEMSLKLWDILLTINDDELQKSSLSILWAILKSSGPELGDKIPNSMIERLLAMQLDHDNLSMIGVIGSIASTINNSTITYQISQFLFHTLSLACENTKNIINLEIIIETLNMIFDIFGDKEYPYDYEVFVKNDYISILRRLEPKLKEIYKKIDKNKEPQLKLKMEETWINLERFIQYKINERL